MAKFFGHGQGLPYVFALLSDKKQSTYEKLIALEKKKRLTNPVFLLLSVIFKMA